MFRRLRVGDPVFVEDGLGGTTQAVVVELAAGKVGIRTGPKESEDVRFVDARHVHREDLGG